MDRSLGEQYKEDTNVFIAGLPPWWTTHVLKQEQIGVLRAKEIDFVFERIWYFKKEMKSLWKKYDLGLF